MKQFIQTYGMGAIAGVALLFSYLVTQHNEPTAAREGISENSVTITPLEPFDALTCEEDDQIIITLDQRNLPIAICMHIDELERNDHD